MGEFDELYYKRPPVYHFDAVVTSCQKEKEGYAITLDRTAFYPEGGGQPSDIGMLSLVEEGGESETPDVHVSNARKRDGQVVHYADLPLPVGAKVLGNISQDRRKHYTENHSGEHLLSGLIHKRFGFENVGFHMNDTVTTIDFDGVLTWEELKERETEANRIVRGNLPIRELFPTKEELCGIDFRSKKELAGQVRLIEIPGADLCACCGTHLERTGQIGLIKVLSLMHYKGGVRIEIVCGKNALLEMQEKTDREIAISRLLSAKPENTVEAVEKLLSDMKDIKQEAVDAINRYFDQRISGYPENGTFVLDFEPAGKPADIRRFCDRLIKENRAMTAAVLAPVSEQNQMAGYAFVIGSKERNLRELVKTLNETLSGRGGGSEQMIQGTFFSSMTEIEDTLRKIFTTQE